jgi:hypothetical protein
MNGRLNGKGHLLIERGGKFKVQSCPFDSEDDCGDWCPLFGEPVRNARGATIETCKKDLYFKTFSDDRKGER